VCATTLALLGCPSTPYSHSFWDAKRFQLYYLQSYAVLGDHESTYVLITSPISKGGCILDS